MPARRCTSESCLLEAAHKSRLFSLELPVADILHNPQREWLIRSLGNRKRVASDRKISVDWKKFNVEDYFFTHCTIVCSVVTASNGYYIEPPCDELVNNNGNAWNNEVLLSTFRSFVGAENYFEHMQAPELSKGKILDAVIRPVNYKGKNGKTADIYYTDILVATDRKHIDLVERIEKGELNTLSMGCFEAGTLVTMANGTRKPIETIEKGERVISHRGYAREVLRPIKTQWLGDMYKVHVEGRPEPIVCTGNHKFWSWQRPPYCACGCGESLPDASVWNKRKSLKTSFVNGHRMRVLNPMVEYSVSEKERRLAILDEAAQPHFEWKEARGLEAGAYLTIPSEYSIGSEDVSVARARLLGLYLAEGSINNCGGYKSVGFTYSLYEKDTLAQETKELLAKEFGVESSVYERSDRNTCETRTHKNDFVTEWFQSHGGHYSWAKAITEGVLHWPLDALRALVGGWLDGDGCMHEGGRKRIIGVTVSADLASQISLILARLGIYHTWNVKDEYESVENGVIVPHRKSHYITIPSSVVHLVTPFTMRWNDGDPRPIHSRCHIQPSSENVVVRVKKVEQLRPIHDDNELSTVYCLEVEEEHSLLVGGSVGVQNCVAHWVTCSKCGKEIADEKDNCEHINKELMTYFTDDKGVKRITAELCGRTFESNGKRVGDQESVQFIEASWVERPAFTGAVLNYYVSDIPEEKKASLLEYSSMDTMYTNLAQLRVADTTGMMAVRLAKEEVKRLNLVYLVNRVAMNGVKFRKKEA